MPSRWSQAVVLLGIACNGVGTQAFVVPSDLSKSRASPELYNSIKKPVRDAFYGENSRQYRRTVYTHDEWVAHRSSDRFVKNLISIGSSGVYKNLAREAMATTGIALFVWSWNLLAGGYTDLEGLQHDPLIQAQLIGLPLVPFTLSSPSLGLLLVFRTTSSYKRWDEARKNWGMNINHTRDLNRMGVAFYDSNGITAEERTADLQRLSLCTWAFVRAMKRHLSPEWEDEEDFKKELFEKLPEEQAKTIIAAAHRPNRALFDLSMAIENLPMHFTRKNEIQAAVTIFEDNLGSCERLLTSPIPLVYTRHTARFLAGWLLLLPFALWEPFGTSWNHISMLPTTAIISVFLFGIEELATQLEEPFSILPMQAFCDKIGNSCNEIVSWEAGDNGMEVAGGFTSERTAIASGGSYSTSEPTPAATDIWPDGPLDWPDKNKAKGRNQ
jgi:putative membrane protein